MQLDQAGDTRVVGLCDRLDSFTKHLNVPVDALVRAEKRVEHLSVVLSCATVGSSTHHHTPASHAHAEPTPASRALSDNNSCFEHSQQGQHERAAPHGAARQFRKAQGVLKSLIMLLQQEHFEDLRMNTTS
jgi:hypothetical protein